MLKFATWWIYVFLRIVLPVAELKDRLRSLQAKDRRTLKEIALACGVTPQAVGGWLKGSRPRSKHIASLAAFFGVSVDYLVHGTGTLGRKIALEELMVEASELDYADIKALVMLARHLNGRKT